MVKIYYAAHENIDQDQMHIQSTKTSTAVYGMPVPSDNLIFDEIPDHTGIVTNGSEII